MGCGTRMDRPIGATTPHPSDTLQGGTPRRTDTDSLSRTSGPDIPSAAGRGSGERLGAWASGPLKRGPGVDQDPLKPQERRRARPPRSSEIFETREMVPLDWEKDAAAQSTQILPRATTDSVVVAGVPSRPIGMLCKHCEQVTRKKSPYCAHCGRPLPNVEGTVQLSCKWSGGQTPAHEPAIYALVTVRPTIRFLSSPPGRNLGLLVDMSTPEARGDASNRNKMVRRILDNVIDELTPTDTLSVCFFGRRPYLLLTAESMADKRATKRLLQTKMDSLDLGEGRYLTEAIEQVCREVRRNFSPDKVNRVIIVTDGACSDYVEALQACEVAAEGGIGFSIMTLGEGTYVEQLTDLSAHGQGKCYPVIDYRHIPEILSQELMTMRATFTTQVEMFVHIDPGWAITRVFKISPVIMDLGSNFGDELTLAIKLNDLQLYDDQTLMLELSPVSVVPHRRTLALCELVCDFPREDITNMSFTHEIQVAYPQAALLQDNPEVLKTVNMIMSVFGQRGIMR